MDPKWAEALARLGAANAEKEKARLAALTLEESGRLFEDLCRLLHAEFDVPRLGRGHGVGLVKYWKKP